MKRFLFASLVFVLGLLPRPGVAQPYDITTFDQTAVGPWSALNATTLMIPKVPNGSIKLDGAASSQEYGGFQGVTVNPGNPDGTVGNAWILDFPADRVWDGPEDSSFTYWLAHDDDNIYIGVLAKDDIVNSDDPNKTFWQDDAIEIQVDALNTRFDTGSYGTPVGGHCYVNFQGRFSAWDDTTGKTNDYVWAPAVSWKYGETEDVFGFGKAVAGGWQMEVRFKKRMFEDPTAGNKLKNGYIMGFNIGMDDDDKKGQGINGDKSRTQDLEVQYWWADRQRYTGYNAAYLDTLTAEEKAAQVWRADTDNHPLALDPTGHAQGGTGEIIFGYDADKQAKGKILYLCANADLSGTDDAGVVALLRAKGYTVTPYTSSGPTGGDDMRAAAVGQDLIMISESLGSGTTLEPNTADPPVQKFIYRDTDIPIISWEAFMWDNAEWTEHPADFSNEFSMFGNTGRTEDTQPADLKLPFDSLYIKNPTHPIAGGLTGKVKVYDPVYSINYAKPSADADVIASVRENGEYPCIFVYEKGDKLVDGSVCPNKRIGLFTAQVAALTANWNPEIRWLTDAGKTLLLNTVAYAIGAVAPPPAADVKSGLVGYWRMDETSGTVVSDFSGNGNNGTIVNSPAGAWVTDSERGTVYKATGTNVINFGVIIPAMTTTNDFTWSLWLKSDETGTAAAADNNIVFGNRYNTAGVDFNPREFIKFTPSNFEWHFNAAGQNVDYTDFVVGKWTHHVVVKQGAKLTYYRDGVEANTGTITGGPKNPQPLYLGGQGTQERWKGEADEVAIYSRALTPVDVKQVFDLGKAGQPLTPPPFSLGPITVNGANLTLTWSGGTGPFMVQKKASLSDANWINVLSTAARTATVLNDGTAGFFRIQDNAQATVTAFKSILTGAAERPTPVTTTGSGAGTLSLDGNTLTYDIAYSGLSANATASHIHGPAGVDAAAGVMVALPGAAGTSGRLTGTLTLTDAQKQDLISGNTYVNIHTTANTGGEIRGQIVP